MIYDPILISLVAFLALFVAGIGFYRVTADSEAKRVRRRLRDLAPRATGAGAPVSTAMLKDAKYSTFGPADVLLRRLPYAENLHLLLRQGEAGMKVGTFVALVVGISALGVLTAALVFHVPWMALPAGVLPGAIPFFWAVHKKNRRIARFEKIFPDALDILTGALRSGLALTGAIQVVAEECADPVAAEFSALFEEIRLGVDTRHALRNLADRVESKELHLFVIAVLLQRETGGNLAEILEGTADVIRDRFRILGDVRALTAQARFSAIILSALPVVMATFIFVSAPEYMRTLTAEQTGRHLLIGAVILQLVGYYFMRRIATIKV